MGTINLDYRSFYHHFECAAYLYATPCIRDIEADFRETERQCRAVTLNGRRDRKRQLVGFLMKPLAPLL